MTEKDERNKIQMKKKRIHPRKRANIISHWFFCWELPFFYKGYKKQLTEEDLYGSLEDHESKMLGDKLEEAWMKETDPSLWKVLAVVFGPEFLMYGLILIPIELGTRITQPVLIGRLMSYYSPNQSTVSKTEAYIYASCVVATSLLYVIMGHSYGLGLQHLGMKIRIACTSLIYRKSLKLSHCSLSEITVGQVVNLLSNDVSRFDYVVLNAHFLWMGPLETIIIFGLLYWMLGPTSVIGIVILLAFIPTQVYLSKKISEYRMRTALKTDQRVRLMNEIITGIKVIKMYTWEKPFAKLVEKARKLEMRQIKTNSYFRGFNAACSIFLGRTAVFSCVLVYVLTGGTLDPEYVYVLTSFYEVIRLGSVIFLPLGMMMFGETLTSVKRIDAFLKKPETATLTLSDSGKIKLDDVIVKWNETSSDNTLTGVTLAVPPSKLVGIIGPVGSGKSTVLETILGEVPILEGVLQIGGTLSYASQQPWVFSGSIRDNIVFGEKFDESRYSEVVRACALEHDLQVLPFGDQSLVGDRGVLLSGGQKARINLARAVYKNADFYLLDDPLSAVDSHVGKKIFETCINGYLKSKARVLVTHQLQYLKGADFIYLVEEGKVVKSGTYEVLKQSDHDFLKLLENQSKGEVDDEADISLSTDQEEKPVEVKESQQDGVVSNRVYRDYFKAGGTVLTGTIIILLAAIVQVSGNGTDYFLSFWVNLEQEHFKRGDLDTNSCLYIQGEFDSCVLILHSDS